MPTYTYRFDDGTEIEVVQPINEAPLTEDTHPIRGRSMPVRRVYHAPSVVLKGRGFYKTGG